MKRDQVLELLGQQMAEIRGRYDVTELAVFGSAARDQLRPDSDDDVLVRFHLAATFAQYLGWKFSTRRTEMRGDATETAASLV
jgi:predicted nucleotidyltransferase